MSVNLTITFNDDGTVDRALDGDIGVNKLLSGFTDVLIEYIEATAPSPRIHNKVITVITEKLNRQKKEETWEYIVQVKRDDQWQFYIGESRLPTDKPGLANGFSQKNHAQEFAKLEGEYPTRIVRRRVSPPEVINE